MLCYMPNDDVIFEQPLTGCATFDVQANFV